MARKQIRGEPREQYKLLVVNAQGMFVGYLVGTWFGDYRWYATTTGTGTLHDHTCATRNETRFNSEYGPGIHEGMIRLAVYNRDRNGKCKPEMPASRWYKAIMVKVEEK